jgi:type VI secretion system protein VasI
MKVEATVFFVLTVAAFAATTGRAAAQGNALALALCRKVPDDQERLKCYDAALDVLLGEKTAKPDDTLPTKPGAWRIEDQKSPVDDSPEVFAALRATSGDAFLIARCKENNTELLFAPESFLINPMTGGVKVLLRINDAPAVTESWAASRNWRAAFSPAAIPTLNILPDNGRLFVRAYGSQGDWTEASFDLGTVSEVREKIRVTCKWYRR